MPDDSESEDDTSLMRQGDRQTERGSIGGQRPGLRPNVLLQYKQHLRQLSAASSVDEREDSGSVATMMSAAAATPASGGAWQQATGAASTASGCSGGGRGALSPPRALEEEGQEEAGSGESSQQCGGCSRGGSKVVSPLVPKRSSIRSKSAHAAMASNGPSPPSSRSGSKRGVQLPPASSFSGKAERKMESLLVCVGLESTSPNRPSPSNSKESRGPVVASTESAPPSVGTACEEAGGSSGSATAGEYSQSSSHATVFGTAASSCAATGSGGGSMRGAFQWGSSRSPAAPNRSVDASTNAGAGGPAKGSSKDSTEASKEVPRQENGRSVSSPVSRGKYLRGRLGSVFGSRVARGTSAGTSNNG